MLKVCYSNSNKMMRNSLRKMHYILNTFQNVSRSSEQDTGNMITQNFLKKKSRHHQVDASIVNYGDRHKEFFVKKNLSKTCFNINLLSSHSLSAGSIQSIVDSYKQDVLVINIDNTYNINTGKSPKLTQAYINVILDAFEKKPTKKEKTLADSNLIYIGIDNFEASQTIRYFPTYTSAINTFIKSHPAKYIHISCNIAYMYEGIGLSNPHDLRCKHIKKIIKTAKPRLVGFDFTGIPYSIGNKKQTRLTLCNINNVLNKVIE